MGKRRLDNWRWWLQIVSLGLLAVAAFAPLPGGSHKIVMGVALGNMLVNISTDSNSKQKWNSRFLLPLLAFVLLAPLFSVPKSVIKLVLFGSLGVCAGICLVYAGGWTWGVLKQEHAEYLTERERLP